MPSFNGLGDGVGGGVGAGDGVVFGVGVAALYITVIVSVAVFPVLSFAVTVMVLSPFDKPIFETDQLVVPLAVPFSPLLLLHVTLLILPELSDAVPLKAMVLLVVL